MVRRLVEHNHVGVAQQRASQGHALALSAAEVVETRRVVGQAELSEHALALQLALGRVLGVLHGGLLDGGGVAEVGRLLQESHACAEAPGHVAAVGALAPADNAQQRRLACAVARHHAYLVALLHAEGDVGEQQSVAVALRKVLYLQYAGHIRYLCVNGKQKDIKTKETKEYLSLI